MKHARLVSQIIIEDNGSYTLHSVKVTVEDAVIQTRLEGTKTPQKNYSNVSALFTALQEQTVAIATSSLV